MALYVINGIIRPEWVGLTFQTDPSKGIPTLSVQSTVAGKCSVAYHIAQNQICLRVETERKPNEVGTFRNELSTICRSMVDAICYQWAMGLDVELTTMIDATTGDCAIFCCNVPEIQNAKSERPQLNPNDLLSLAVSNVHLRRALSDLREAIRNADDTGFFCFRAIESIRQHFKSSSNSDAQSWERLRQSLHVDRSWIDVITPIAEALRHGENTSMTGAQRLKVMQHAWKIVDRFYVYLHGQEQRLSDAHFPILK